MQIPVKVKATGEIVDVTISVAVAGNPLYTTSGGVTYLGDEIEPAEPDWQHYRIQAAIAAMQGMLSSKETMVSVTAKAKERNISVPKALAMLSVSYADTLVEELKKG